MNDLLRELAPISNAAWHQVDDEATKTLKLTLAARKLVDFSGPHGWNYSAIDLGRCADVPDSLGEGVSVRRRLVQPLIELRVPFELQRRELETVARGGKDADWRPLVEAARSIAMAEDRAVFSGFRAGGIAGIAEMAETAALPLTDDYAKYPIVVAEALNKLRNLGVDGPYGIALGSRCYTGLTETTANGSRVYEHVRRLLDGPIVWAPAVDGAVVLSMRKGDFELTVGQDFSIGYLDHSATAVELYLQESFTFRVLTAEAAVPLRYARTKSK